MTARDRIRLGQKVTEVALLVREASAPAALFGLCLLVFVSMEPTRRAIDPSWAVALPVVAFIAFRTAAVCLGPSRGLFFRQFTEGYSPQAHGGGTDSARSTRHGGRKIEVGG